MHTRVVEHNEASFPDLFLGVQWEERLVPCMSDDATINPVLKCSSDSRQSVVDKHLHVLYSLERKPVDCMEYQDVCN